MSLLLDKRELKKAAKELSVLKLQEVIEVLQSVMTEREKEAEALELVRQFAKAQGFTLEQLGYRQSVDAPAVTAVATEEVESVVDDSKRPIKPKFKTINKESQYFYVDGGVLNLLKTHTMKKALQERGIDVVAFDKVDKKYRDQVAGLLSDATAQAIENFNAKVDVWNEWAKAHNDEILEKR